MIQVKKNAAAMAQAFMDKGYDVVSGGTDNHMMLIDLRNKGLSGKQAEEALGKATITVNKNMVPFDDQSPFITSGIRLGTPAVTTRGLKEKDMIYIVDLIDEAISNFEDEQLLDVIGAKVKELMSSKPLFTS